jgi:hypothetical protein
LSKILDIVLDALGNVAGCPLAVGVGEIDGVALDVGVAVPALGLAGIP